MARLKRKLRLLRVDLFGGDRFMDVDHATGWRMRPFRARLFKGSMLNDPLLECSEFHMRWKQSLTMNCAWDIEAADRAYAHALFYRYTNTKPVTDSLKNVWGFSFRDGEDE